MVDDPKPTPAFVISGDVGRAPVIFFDEVPSFGGFNGIVSIPLTAALQAITGDGNVKVEHHVVAHLRTNVQGIKALRAAIDGALLALEPTKGQAN